MNFLPIIIIAVIGLISGLGLSVASIVFEVPADEKSEGILKLLPGVNCGACGYSGCAAYAKAIANDKADINLCTPGGNDTAKAIADFLGIAAVDVSRKFAVVHCLGNSDNTPTTMEYIGHKTCAEANMYFAGNKACSWACLGYGDCQAVCQYDAIDICNSLAKINPDKCVACGLCVKACPKDLIDMVPDKPTAIVLCSNKDKGALTRKVCKVGCIVCKRCEKACEYDAIHVKDNLASVDYDKCTACGECVKVCPVNCIILHTPKAAAAAGKASVS